jgi:outer membrane protein OmpA-like peptidoglycan-associated protein
MKTILLAGAAMAAVFAATGASAEGVGWYVAGDAGYHETNDFSLSGPAFTGKATLNGNWAGFARLGYQITPHWRVEGEYGYRPTDVHTFTAPGLVAGRGSANANSYMGNVIFDFMPDAKLDPFLGVGGGGVQSNAKLSGAVGSQSVSAGDNQTRGAWQGVAGVAWAVGPRLNIDFTYRYTASEDLSLKAVQNGAPIGSMKAKWADNSITVGLRYSFAPPPPPPPPPPVAEAKEFIVYFPFDQYVLTTEAQAVVQQAADYSKTGTATKIVVVGHTDTSGSVKYNIRLSERRAKAVADALVGAGVQQTVLSVDWKGKSEPAVQTGDGVKEPLNRRATININF